MKTSRDGSWTARTVRLIWLTVLTLASSCRSTAEPEADSDAPQADSASVEDEDTAQLPVDVGDTDTVSDPAAPTLPSGSFDRTADTAFCAERRPATVSSFALDRAEVSVSRFREFLDAGGGVRASPPEVGAGAHPAHPSTGWQSEWDQSLAASRDELESSLDCGSRPTWTSAPTDHENMPLNCVDWYTAFAFCAWDGGRLPSEAEWVFAATGGSQARARPWGDTNPTAEHAVYGSDGARDVGSALAGAGAWGHVDLVGNVWEWTLDSAPDGMLLPIEGAEACSSAGMPQPCSDCVGSSGPLRVSRGGGWGLPRPAMRSAIRRADAADAREHVIGVRCARTATGSAAAASVPETATETEVDPTEWAGSNWDFRVVGGPWPSLSTLPSLPDEGARAYVVQSGWVVWDADLMAGLRGRDLEVILVLTDGQNRGQAADVGNVLEYSGEHEGWPIAIDLSGEINRLAESEPCVVRVTSSPGPVRCIAPSEDEFWGSMEGG